VFDFRPVLPDHIPDACYKRDTVFPYLQGRSPVSHDLSRERHCSIHSGALPGCAGCPLLRVFFLRATDQERDSRGSSYDEKIQGRSLLQREDDARCDEGWGVRGGSGYMRLLWGAGRWLANERPNQRTIRTLKK
jgi:hypothetical protein